VTRRSWITKGSRFELDLTANFAYVVWSFAVQIVSTPLYLRFLGIEAYGLISFYLMLQAILQILDLGLSPTINREMARYSVLPDKAAEARDLVRTLEAGYWLIGIVIGLGIWKSAPLIAASWIKAGMIPVRTVSNAVMLMGILSVLQWPFSLYQGALMGLSRQVQLNSLKIVMVTLSQMGAVIALWLISSTIFAFLWWQVVVAGIQLIVLRLLLQRCLPQSNRPVSLDFKLVRGLSHFAAGVGTITLIGLALTQVDKLIVSKLFPLRVFAYYTLAWTVANGLVIISGAVFNVVFPRFSAQVAAGDEHGIRMSYHRSSQLMAVIVLPAAAVISLFSFDILRLWTNSSDVALNAAPILSILVIGSALNALLFLPYAIQLAYGWTNLSLVWGLISISVCVPILFIVTKRFGVVGAATVWAALNVTSLVLVVPIMHRRLLRGETWAYFRDIGVPLAGTVLTATVGRFLFVNPTSRIMTITVLSAAWISSMITAILATPYMRTWARTKASRLLFSYAE
jgi:O-antigen/teichoic acid export membrane protein